MSCGQCYPKYLCRSERTCRLAFLQKEMAEKCCRRRSRRSLLPKLRAPLRNKEIEPYAFARGARLSTIVQRP
jgi:hypothetical protein